MNETKAAIALSKALINNLEFIFQGGIAEGVGLFEDYILSHKLLIKLWQLDENKVLASRQISICRESIREAEDTIEKLKNLIEVPNEQEAKHN